MHEPYTSKWNTPTYIHIRVGRALMDEISYMKSYIYLYGLLGWFHWHDCLSIIYRFLIGYWLLLVCWLERH
jgi:hypothetical protein